MPFRAILFDVGDTLLPATELQQSTLRTTAQILEAQGCLKDSAKFVEAYERADQAPEFDTLPDLNHLYSDKRIVAHALKLLRLPPDSRCVRRFLRTYREKLREQLRPDPATIRTLSQLRNTGMRLGVVSNGTTVEQMDQLARLGIRDYFDPILISQAVGIRKPDPEIFLKATSYWKMEPSSVLVVGDRPDWEVAGAKRAGMRSALTTQFVQHDHYSKSLRPDFIIHDLAQLPELLLYAE